MSQNSLLNFWGLRSPQALSQERINSLGIPAIPIGSIEAEFIIALQRACRSKDRETYNAILKRFFEGREFIFQASQLPEKINQLYLEYSFYGSEINAEKFRAISSQISEKDIANFVKPPSTLPLNIGMSYVAASLAGAYGKAQLLDYPKFIKFLFLLSYSYENREELTDPALRKIQDYPVILPKGIMNFRCCHENEMDSSVNPSYFIDLLEKSQSKRIFRNSPDPGSYNEPDPCECECDDSCKDPDQHCMCLKPYIADLYIVKEELNCYELGHIAHITNVLGGEKLERTHRTLTKTENYSEKESKKETSNIRDLQNEERFDLQKEIQRTTSKRISTQTGIKAHAEWGDSYSLDTSFGLSTNSSKRNATREAKTYAKNIIDRSIESIQESFRELTSRRVIHEIEETNLHGIDNTKGGNRRGIYYFVNEKHKAQIYNYGIRTMLQLFIPEPLAMYRKLHAKEAAVFEGKTPPHFPNINPESINSSPNQSNYYADLARNLNADSVSPPPPTKKILSKILKYEVETIEKYSDIDTVDESVILSIDEGYEATKVSVTFMVSWNESKKDHKGHERNRVLYVNVGDEVFNINRTNYPGDPSSATINRVFGTPKTGEVAIGVLSWSTIGYSVSIEVECSGAAAFSAWQHETYNSLLETNNSQWDEYNQAKAIFEREQKIVSERVNIGKNPFLNREIERTELKRQAIEILRCKHFDGMDFSAMQEKVKPCGFPLMNFKKAEEEAPEVQFFETAFEWNNITYMFYRYFWGRVCKFKENNSSNTGDPLFDAACDAGYARLQLPIRPGFEEFVNHYLSTGEIYNGEKPPSSGDPGWLPIWQEIKEDRDGHYTMREGFFDGLSKGDLEIKLEDSARYWDFINNTLDSNNIDSDINREIVIDCIVYCIKDIRETSPADPNHLKWIIELDRPIEADIIGKVGHQTGYVKVGEPWFFTLPSQQVFLGGEGECLPCNYPLKNCPPDTYQSKADLPIVNPIRMDIKGDQEL